MREIGQKGLGFLLGVGVGGDLYSERLQSRKGVIVLEVVHVVVSDRRSTLEFDMAVDDLCLQVGRVHWSIVNDSGGGHDDICGLLMEE